MAEDYKYIIEDQNGNQAEYNEEIGFRDLMEKLTKMPKAKLHIYNKMTTFTAKQEPKQ
jgi:hypothetical protein